MKIHIISITTLILLSSACVPSTTTTEVVKINSIATQTATIPANSIIPSVMPPQPPDPNAWIAFIHKNNLWLVHPDGNGLIQITSNTLPKDSQTVSIIHHEWSPDGSRLAFSQEAHGEAEIFLYDPKTDETVKLVFGSGGGFNWSTNGRQIIYDSPPDWFDPNLNNGIWLINLENLKKRRIVPPTNEISGMLNPKWSIDGSQVIFNIASQIPSEYGISDFATRSAFSLPYTGLTNCEWSPVELMIACIKHRAGEASAKTDQQLFYLFLENRQERTVPLREYANQVRLVWSPDGSHLAIGYIDETRRWTDIVTTETDEFKELSSGLVSSWSHDGSWIAVSDLGLDGLSRIFLVNVQTGERIALTEGTSPVWQPFSHAEN
jgi:Tol biopolymer transport system component